MLKDFLPRYGLVMIVALAIVYGSLYPFRLRDPGSFGADLLHLAGTWRQLPQGRGDLLANLFLYMPLGLTIMLALRPARWPAWLFAVGMGAVLSVSMELTQFYDDSRVSALSDVYLNVLGTLAGCVLAGSGSARALRGWWQPGSSAAFARLLLLAWLGWRLYPYVPTIDMHKYWRSVRPLLSEAALSPYEVFRLTLLWLGVAFLFRSGLRTKNPTLTLCAAIAAFFAARIFIIDQVLSWPDIAGALLALILAPLVFGRLRRFGIPVLDVFLLGLMVTTRLLPWQFTLTPKPFQWVPFFGFLHGSLQVDIISFAQKFYLYGVVVLLLVTAGLRLRTAVLLECTILLVCSILQIFMVGRSAEVTDAVLALALGVIFALMRRASSGTPPLRDTVPDALRTR